MSEKFDLEQLVRKLAQERDELRVKLHLAKADARDEWARVEQQWEGLEAKMPGVKAELGDAAQNVGAALKLVAEEIQSGYQRIRKLF